MPKEEKQINALLYAINNYPSIGRVKLMKFVFFVDLLNYNRTGDTLLEDEYLRLPNGPVPNIGFSYSDKSNADFSVEIQMLDAESIMYQYKPKKAPNLTMFNDSEVDLFDAVLRLLKRHNTPQISDITHQWDLWIAVPNGGIIAKESLKLEEYEFNTLESMLALSEAEYCASKVEEYGLSEGSDLIPPELLELEFLALDNS
jgi:hypothetical protein